MFKKPRDFNAVEFILWMYAFNPGKIDIYISKDYPRYLISFVPITNLKFPEGWYYSKDSKTIHKENSNITVCIIIKE